MVNNQNSGQETSPLSPSIKSTERDSEVKTTKQEQSNPESSEQTNKHEKVGIENLEVKAAEQEQTKLESSEQTNEQEKVDIENSEVKAAEQEQTNPESSEQTNEQEKVDIESLETSTAEQKKYFIADVFLTAGPRKNFTQFASEGDRDLGEDVAGCVVLKDKVIFWVLDGTSDSTILKLDNKEIFSSRLLAQNIAINIRKLAIKAISSKDLLQSAVQITMEDWRSQFDDLKERKNEIARDFRTETYDVSTTIIAGIMDINGKLDVSRVGDCKMICINSQDAFLPSALSNDLPRELRSRQFARLVFHSHKLDVSFSENYEKMQTDILEDAKSLFAFSDGVSQQTQNYIKVTFSKLLHEKVIEQIQKIPQKTNDDKALLTVQIQSI